MKRQINEWEFGSGYVQGYTAALQDVIVMIDCVERDYKRQKVRRSANEYKKMVECMIKGRAILREDPDAFVRRNAKTGEYEIYIAKVGVYEPDAEEVCKESKEERE